MELIVAFDQCESLIIKIIKHQRDNHSKRISAEEVNKLAQRNSLGHYVDKYLQNSIFR